MQSNRTVSLVAFASLLTANILALPAVAQMPAKQPPSMSYKLSGPFSCGNVSLYLVRGNNKVNYKQYLTLPEAIAHKQVVVQETGDVNCLKIDNLSDAVVFIQSGEIVKGGRQDRALQIDMLIRPRAKGVSLPCFCVESGRWSGRVGESASQFQSANNFVVGNSMQLAIKKDGDQSKVWQQVEAKQQQLSRRLTSPVASSLSPTSLQLTLEQKSVKEATEIEYKALADLVNKDKDAIGYAVAINGKLSSGDIYASGELFKKLWPGLLRSAVTEAVAQRGQSIRKLPTESEVRTVLVQSERGSAYAPTLQGATNGTIGQQGSDATYVTGVNTAGTVRPTPGLLDYFFKTTDKQSGVVIHENFLNK